MISTASDRGHQFSQPVFRASLLFQPRRGESTFPRAQLRRSRGLSQGTQPQNHVLTESKRFGVETLWVVSPMALTAPLLQAGGSLRDCAGSDLPAERRQLGRDTHSPSQPVGREKQLQHQSISSSCDRICQSAAPEPHRETHRRPLPTSHPTAFGLPHAPQPRTGSPLSKRR